MALPENLPDDLDAALKRVAIAASTAWRIQNLTRMIAEDVGSEPLKIGDTIAAELAEEGLRLAKEFLDARGAFRPVQSDLRVASTGSCAHEEMLDFARNVNFTFAMARNSDDFADAIQQQWSAIYGTLREIPGFSKPEFDDLQRRMFVEAEKAAESRHRKTKTLSSAFPTFGVGPRIWNSTELPKDLRAFLKWAKVSADALQKVSSASESPPQPPSEGMPGVSPYASLLHLFIVSVDLDIMARTLHECIEEAEQFDPKLISEIRSPAIGTFRFERGNACSATTASKALLEAVPMAWHRIQSVVAKADDPQERLAMLRSFEHRSYLPHGNIEECMNQICREIEDTALARRRTGESGEPLMQDGEVSSEPSITLDVRHRKILDAMLSLDATSRDKLQSADKIAAKAIDSRATSDAVKDELGQLKVAGLVEPKKGRGGGYWLTANGICTAKKR